MGRLGIVLRWLLGFEAVAAILGIWDLAQTVLPDLVATQSQAFTVFFFVALSYVGFTAALAAFVSWGMESSTGWVRPAGLLVSLMNLLIFPFGTGIGIAGLIYFARKRVSSEPAQTRIPVKGDGTTRWSAPLAAILQIALLFVVLRYARAWAEGRGVPRLDSPIAWWILFVLSIHVGVAIHELGHYIAGRWVGFRLLDLRISALRWQYLSGKWRFGLVASWGGHVGMAPTSVDRIRQRMMVMFAGGPAGSLAVAGIGFNLLWLTPPSMLSAVAGEFLILTAINGFIDLVVNLIPLASGVYYSDGARLWQIHQEGPWAQYLTAHQHMAMSQATPLPPRDWPTEMVEQAAEFARSLPEAPQTLALAYAHFEDRGEIERALVYLDQASAAVQPRTEYAHNLAYERAFTEAYYRRDEVEALKWFEQTRERFDLPDYWRAKTATLALQGDRAGAREAWQRGWELASTLPNAGVHSVDRRHFELLSVWLRENTDESEAKSLAQAS